MSAGMVQGPAYPFVERPVGAPGPTIPAPGLSPEKVVVHQPPGYEVMTVGVPAGWEVVLRRRGVGA